MTSPSPTIVHSQSEFDAAVTAGAQWIRIDSPRGVWIEVSTPREVDVEIVGSSSARLSGSSSASLSDSSSASLFDSSSASLFDSSSASLSGSSSARARGASSISLFDCARAEASSGVAVHLHSGHAHIDGGVLIDHTDVDLTDVPTWLDYKGITVADGIATFYKAVDADLNAGHGYTLTAYPIGETVTAPDWNPRAVCGGGLHATGDPGLSDSYYNGDGRCRYLELAVPINGLVLLEDKVKFQTCTVVREVNIAAKPLAVSA